MSTWLLYRTAPGSSTVVYESFRGDAGVMAAIQATVNAQGGTLGYEYWGDDSSALPAPLTSLAPAAAPPPAPAPEPTPAPPPTPPSLPPIAPTPAPAPSAPAAAPTGAVTQIDPGVWRDPAGNFFTSSNPYDATKWMGLGRDQTLALASPLRIYPPVAGYTPPSAPAPTPAPAPSPAPTPAPAPAPSPAPAPTPAAPGVRPIGAVTQIDPGVWIDPAGYFFTTPNPYDPAQWIGLGRDQAAALASPRRIYPPAGGYTPPSGPPPPSPAPSPVPPVVHFTPPPTLPGYTPPTVPNAGPLPTLDLPPVLTEGGQTPGRVHTEFIEGASPLLGNPYVAITLAVIGALFGIFHGGNSDVTELRGEVKSLRDKIVDLGITLLGFTAQSQQNDGKTAGIFGTIFSKVLGPIINALVGLVGGIHDLLAKWLGPLLKYLNYIKEIIKRIYNDILKPILAVIDTVRAVLKVLEFFHVPFAQAVDDALGKLEQKLTAPLLAVLSKVNELSNWINRIVTLDGLFQRTLLLQSLARHAAGMANLWWNSQTLKGPPTPRAPPEDPQEPIGPSDVADGIGAYMRDGSGPFAEIGDRVTALVREELA